MSVINQMLKDLEERRADSLATPDGVFSELSWSSEAGGTPIRRHGWLVSLALTVLILAAVIAYLLYTRSSPDVSSTMPELTTIKPAPTVVAPPAPTRQLASSPATNHSAGQPKKEDAGKISEPMKPPAIAQSPVKASTRQVKPVQAEQTKLEQTRSLVKPTTGKPVTKTPVANKTAAGVGVDEGSGQIQKRQRPLTRQQKAERSFQRAYAQLQQGHLQQGTMHLQQALQYDPSHRQARELLAGAYIKSRRLVEAEMVLREGVRLWPADMQLSQLYARLLLQQKKAAAAVKVLVSHRPAVFKQPDYYALLAAAYQQAGKHGQAAEIYFALVKAYPANGMWWLGRAMALEASTQRDEAASAYHKAIESGSLKPSLLRYAKQQLAGIEAPTTD